MGKTVYQFLIIFTVIIGAFGQLPVHTLYISLHLKDMLKASSASCMTVRSSLSIIT